MALVVRLQNSLDRERFDDGTSFHVGESAELKIFDGHKLIAVFAPGQWTGVLEIQPSQAKKEQPRGGGGFGLGTYHVYLDGQHLATRGDRS